MNYAVEGAPRALLNMCRSSILEKYEGGVDLMLLAGDITDHANSKSLAEVWADLHWLAEKLEVPLIATSGNHDYDSRATEDSLPYKSLLKLEPSFPFGDDAVRNKYFSEHHAVYVNDQVIVITANSSAHHGYAREGSPEHAHGRYSDALPDLLERTLAAIEPKPRLKIFLTHHHLNQIPGMDVEERQSSIGHEDVLRKIAEHGSWLIVHGHKHHGWLQYASGTGDAPPLLSASSFSADLGGGSFAEKVRHQFHVVEFSSETASLEEITGVWGRVTSWTHSAIGWSIASADDDMPGTTGFGWKTNIHSLALRLVEKVVEETVMSKDELLDYEPRLTYLTFEDLRRLREALSRINPLITLRLSALGDYEELVIQQEVNV